jgi:HEAT repeat protein
VAALVELLKDSNGVLRSYAAVTLSLIGPDAEEAVPALVKLLNDPIFGVDRTAAEALARIQEAT